MLKLCRSSLPQSILTISKSRIYNSFILDRELVMLTQARFKIYNTIGDHNLSHILDIHPLKFS